MSLIKEIESDILNSEIKLSSILRKAMVLASDLRNEKFKKWINNELNGYQKGSEEIPNYRRIYAPSFGHFLGSFGVQMKNIPIPTLTLQEKIKEFINELPIHHGVRALESLVESDNPNIRVPWPPDIIVLTSDQFYEDYTLISAHRTVGKHILEQILDTVRTNLLKFILELQEMYPEIGQSEGIIQDIPEEKVNSVFNTYVIGSQNIVAAGIQIDQEIQQQIVKNDINALLDYMTQIGIPENEVQDLRRAIELDGPRSEPKKFGSKVVDWVGRVTKEALKGTYKTTASIASKLIIEALFRYYGWE